MDSVSVYILISFLVISPSVLYIIYTFRKYLYKCIRILFADVGQILYRIRIYHLIYYLTPDEFKTDPEQPLKDRHLLNALLCHCCNSSLLLFQFHHCWNRTVVDKFRNLFDGLCSCIIERRQTRNNNDNLELPISHPLPHYKSDSTIEKNQKDMCNNKELCPPEPAVILTVPPRTAPMSTTTNTFYGSP
ncbi:hypothetical protein BDC45DRAFT_529561 [Circinella umbellata]|nr:hypothetical protein BDC45DRAFT_529561 [Circinella umbellata]